jgi:hypothetical protein
LIGREKNGELSDTGGKFDKKDRQHYLKPSWVTKFGYKSCIERLSKHTAKKELKEETNGALKEKNLDQKFDDAVQKGRQVHLRSNKGGKNRIVYTSTFVTVKCKLSDKDLTKAVKKGRGVNGEMTEMYWLNKKQLADLFTKGQTKKSGKTIRGPLSRRLKSILKEAAKKGIHGFDSNVFK